MSRNPLYQFVDTDTTKLEAALVDAYEAIVGHSAQPSSPERIFIAWVASIILQERVYLNHAGNQNIPSRAEGANLDALGELFYQHTRPAATSSTVTMRFNISEAQTSAVLIPKGTRVSNGQNMFWATVEDRYIAAGQTYGDVTAECMTAGTAGNGYLAGQIATIVDVFDYYTSCTNLTESGGGSDAPTDDEFYEQLRQSEDNYSTAGPKGGYIAKAKAVSNDIADSIGVPQEHRGRMVRLCGGRRPLHIPHCTGRIDPRRSGEQHRPFAGGKPVQKSAQPSGRHHVPQHTLF